MSRCLDMGERSIILCLINKTFNRVRCFRSAKKRLEEEARTKRTNRMLIAMVVIFGTSWAPINIINLFADCMDLSKCCGIFQWQFKLNIRFASESYDILLTYNLRIILRQLTLSILCEDCWPLYYFTFFLCHVVAMSSTCYVSPKSSHFPQHFIGRKVQSL